MLRLSEIKTPQLHIHVIARYESDPAWPKTVWDHPQKELLSLEGKQHRINRLKQLFSNCL